MDQSSKFTSCNFLGNHVLEIKIPSSNHPERTSWVVIRWRKNRIVNELHLPSPGDNLTRSELLLSEQAVAKKIKSELCFTELEQSRSEETLVRDQSGLLLIQCATRKELSL